MVLRESDYIQKVAERVKRNLEKGYKPEALKWALVKQGYTKTEVDKAIKAAQEQLAMEKPKVEPVAAKKVEIIAEPIVEEKKGFWKKLFG